MKGKKPTYKELANRVLELESTLTKTQWLYKKENVNGTEPYVPFYGDVTKLNIERTILDSVGKENLKILTSELMDLLDTSVAIYEKNGDYAFGVFNSGWCQLLDASSRKLCNTDDNKIALNCGKWICHEDCWNNSAKAAILSKQPTDIDCVGGIKLYGEPIFVENEVVGAINIGYGNPPTDDKTLKEIAEKYHIDIEALKEIAYAYNPRPNFIFEVAKKRLSSIAKLIGEIITNKQKEGLFQAKSYQYLTLIESSPIIIVSHKLDGTITYINKIGAEFLNIDPKIVIGKNINTILNIKEVEYQKNLKLLLSNENKFYKTEEHYEINGKTRIVEITGTPIFDKNVIKEVLVQASDITESKLAENTLKESENKLKYIVENSTNVFYSHTIDHKITYISPKICEILGYQLNELMKDWTSFITDNPINEQGLELTEKAIKTGKRQPTYLLELRHKSGKKIIVEVREEPIIENGEVTSIVGSLTDITDRLDAEKVLRKNQIEFDALMSNSPVCTKKLDLDFNLQFISMAGIEQLKIEDVNEFYNAPYPFYFFPETFKKQMSYALKEVTQTGKTKLIDGILTDTEGNKMWYNHILVPIKNSENQLDCIFVLSTDISGRKKAEQERVELIDLNNIIFDKSPIGMGIYNKDGQCIRTNDYSAEIVGATKNQLLQQNFHQIESWKNSGLYDKAISALNNFQTEYLTINLTSTFNKNLWLNCKLTPFVSLGDTYLMLNYEDITERKQKEEKLAESNERLNLSLEINHATVFEDNLETGEMFCTPEMFQHFGYETKEIPTTIEAYMKMLHPDDISIVMKSLNEHLEGTKPDFFAEYRILDKAGNWQWIDGKGKVVSSDTNNKPKILIGISRDINKSKIAEQELIKAKEKAEESDRLKSAFLANMSHEIRTPMNGILGFTDLLKEANLTGDERQNYIDVIEKSGDRMLNTINDIIDFSRIESGEVITHIKPTNINTQLESLYDFFKPEAEKKNIKLCLEPGLDENSANILTDPEKFDAIFTNLIKNALKFTPNGFIECGYTLKGGILHFYVKDSGLGIDSSKREKIFERFIQEDDSHTRVQQGSGLGLSIVKAYVELLEGKIWVESVKEEGSAFHFTIPYQPAKKGLSGNETNDKESEAIINNFINKTILIVEDDESSYEYLKVVIKNYGVVNIVLAKNGEESIKQCKENPAIDLVLMDINMPVMNGYEATKAIKALRSDLPIIAQTAYAIAGDREKSLKAGCDDYITKPVKKEELLDKMEKFLS